VGYLIGIAHGLIETHEVLERLEDLEDELNAGKRFHTS